MSFDPTTYHVSDDLGDGWEGHPDLNHIEPGLRALAVPIGVLKEDANNVRVHNEENLQGVADSYGLYRQRVLAVCNKRDMALEKGNGSLVACKKLGYKFMAALFVDDDQETAKGFAIADNRTSEMATWDVAKLTEQLAELDWAVPGVTQDWQAELKILGDAASFDPDEEPQGEDPGPDAPPVVPQSKLGEIYQLGPHRLACGDSSDVSLVAKLFQGRAARMIWTDPPYGVEYVVKAEDMKSRLAKGNLTKSAKVMSEQRANATASSHIRIQNDDEDSALKITTAALSVIPTEKGAAIYVATPSSDIHPKFWGAINQAGFQLRWSLVWVKNTHVLSRADYNFAHELILYGWKPDGPHQFLGHHHQSTFHVAKPKKNVDHPTTKPVELIDPMVRNSAKQGEIVMDSFGGSGSTLIACAIAGRVCYTIELEPGYCDVIRRRYGEWARAQGIEPGEDAL